LPSSNGWTVSNWAWTSAACTSGGSEVPADPVLLRADAAGDVRVGGAGLQSVMDRHDLLDGEALACRGLV
jgi:hypothetical protein